jgi:hypothetical protein
MSGYAGDQAGTAAGRRRGSISGQAGHQPFEAVDALIGPGPPVTVRGLR